MGFVIMNRMVTAGILTALAATAALAQPIPSKPVKIEKLRGTAPGAETLYTIDVDGTVRVDWEVVETLASTKADMTMLPVAQMMLAVRDGKWKPAR